MALVKPPLRKVISQQGVQVTLECGHCKDRRPGFEQPKRMMCVTCLPLADRQAWMRARPRRPFR